MKRLIALFAALVVSTVGAQTVQTTPNLITSGTSHTWTGVTTGALPANYMPGGPTPIYDPSSNSVTFSYNANATVAQTIAINNALANAGAGVKINGYDYKYDIRNMNGDNRQGGTDTLTVTQSLVGTNNAVLLSSSQVHNTKFEWKTVSDTVVATNPIALANASYLKFSMTGGDNGYWGGYFGPQVRNVNMRLNYTVDPCATNPAFSPDCANYSTVNVSNNLVPNPGAYAYGGYSIDQSYAIDQALGLSGSGVMIHGFRWGYIANTNGTYCSNWLVVCWETKTPTVTTSVNITDNNNNSIYSVNRTYQNSYNTTNYSYIFPTSRNLSTLGRFNFTGTTNDQGAFLGEMWSKALYTPDPCTVNPLSSTTCSGYQQAFHDQQCSINPLFAVDCAGYQAAYTTQQCNANPLYSPSCPGYDAAYTAQQCSINPLYRNTCPGYQQAYYNQQCSINPLYDSGCNGYQQARHDQQCSLNPLYATDCLGYQQAYFSQQCSLNPLYSSQCPGYQQAYYNQQCSINPLYDSGCPGYQTAYKTQQCTANPLYATDCPGYTVAYKTQQCNLSPLYATDCPGYDAAYKTQQCSISPLYASDCPGYADAYFTQQCTANPLYNTACPGYTQAYFNQQCTASALYNTQCPGYAQAYATKQLLATPIVTTPAAAPVEATATTVTQPVQSPVTQATTAPSTTSATSPTSVTSVIAAPSTTSPTGVTSLSATASTQNSSSSSSSSPTSTSSAPAPKQSVKEPDQKSADAKAKAATQSVKNATKMEDQVAAQGAVVNAMAFVPGFAAYQNSIVPDINQLRMARQYSKPPVDNNRTQRLLGGAQEQRWNEMVDSQYNNYNRGN
jgi:hypothetical protein